MQTLRHSFLVLQCLGLWRPLPWPPGWKANLYNSYTCFMVFLMTTVVISQFIELVSSIDDVEAFANNSFILLTMVGDCGKGANILIRRAEIIELTSILHRDPCRPKTEGEFTIQRKFDRLVRSNTLCYAGLTGLTASALALKSFVTDVPRRSLPFKAWLPFDHCNSIPGYSIAYSHQIVTFLAGAGVSASFDTLVPGLMLQTCAQLNILKRRFHELPEVLHDKSRVFCDESTSNYESELLSQRIKHHLEIFKFAETSNHLFGLMIFVQYTTSGLVLCVSVLELSKMQPLSPEFTGIVMYLTCMIAQIFIFCFYGSELTVQSINVGDAIYDMDWTVLSIKARRSLLTIMTRSLRPIKFTSIQIITLNLDSFNSLIKLSYSAYNVLQQSQ